MSKQIPVKPDLHIPLTKDLDVAEKVQLRDSV